MLAAARAALRQILRPFGTFGKSREDVLPVRHRSQHALLDPFTVGEDALLVAARAEVARLEEVGDVWLIE
jgi:hypothetical protein